MYGGKEENGEFCCGCFRFLKPNLILVALCALADSGEVAILDKLARRRQCRMSIVGMLTGLDGGRHF